MNDNRLSESDALERVRASFRSCSIDGGGGNDDDGKSLSIGARHVCFQVHTLRHVPAMQW